GRLLGDPKVGLGALIAQECGVHLRKEHSAADWSRRPLPDDWLVYAALDVELLIPLRDAMEQRLTAAGKDEWAREDFAALAAGAGVEPEQREDPWRRLSGLHSLKSPAQLALARALYEERDGLARKLDKGPGRIVNDRSLVALCALVDAKRNFWPSRADLRTIDGFTHRVARRYENNWLDTIARVAHLRSSAYPQKKRVHDGPPTSMKAWEQHYPEAFARWELVRQLQLELAEHLTMPPENVCSPGHLRQLAWEPTGFDATSIAEQLRGCGARPWQAAQVAPLVERAWAELTS
ncbi:MAG: HRDC domain-containing protein, partial [Propionibacteriaceae bacterium]